VDLEETMTGELAEHGGRHPLPELNQFVDDMKDLGIDDGSTVIIYDDGGLSMACRLRWLLKYIGKDKVFILEGGFDNWVKNGGESTTMVPDVKRSDNLTMNINHKMTADM